jgi:hypothetical protein
MGMLLKFKNRNCNRLFKIALERTEFYLEVETVFN